MARRPLPNHYAALEVREDADDVAIKKAYRSLVMLWHPDRHPKDRSAAEERIRLINTAYEVLGNPTKRESYDLQRAAVDSRSRGLLAKPRVSARVETPKEFMMQPVGFPDKFVRCLGRKVLVQARAETKVDFKAFFRSTKMSLWWLPEVNNMCRIRGLGSKARGDKKGAGAGLAGGLNIAFKLLPGRALGISEVAMAPANKGQKEDNVNFVARASPVYEGAMRFETACRRGHYLAYMPPSDIRVVPMLQQEDQVVMDFIFVDFATMYKLIELEEVLLPAVGQQPDAWVPLAKIRTNQEVKDYFKEVLHGPVWDEEDFSAYFEGHWATWEFRKGEEPSVRLRPPHERLGQRVLSGATAEAVIAEINAAGDELKRLPVPAAVRALEVFSELASGASADPEKPKPEGLAEAQAKLASQLRQILAGSPDDAPADLSASRLLDAADFARTLGDLGPNEDVLIQCSLAARHLTERAIAEAVHGDGASLQPEDVARFLKLPSNVPSDSALASACEPLLEKAELPLLLESLRTASKRGFATVAGHAARRALGRLDALDSEQGSEILRALSEAGTGLDQVAEHVRARSESMSAPALASTLLALAGKEGGLGSLEPAVERLASLPSFSELPRETQVALASAALKNSALTPVASAVAAEASKSAEEWSTVDLSKMLLLSCRVRIDAGVRGALTAAATAALLKRLESLQASELTKLAAGASGGGASALLTAVVEQVLSRIHEFTQQELFLVTQALAIHVLAAISPNETRRTAFESLIAEWTAILAPKSKPGGVRGRGRGRGNAEDPTLTDELSADQLAKLAQTAQLAMGPAHVLRLSNAVATRLIPIAGDLSSDLLERLFAELRSGDEGPWKAVARRGELLAVVRTALRQSRVQHDSEEEAPHRKKRQKR